MQDAGLNPDADGDEPRPSAGLDAAEDGVFHDWLQRQFNDPCIVKFLLFDNNVDVKQFNIPNLLNNNIILKKIQLLAKRDLLVEALRHVL